MPKAEHQRNEIIDGLRGFSIFLVVLLHLQIRIPFEQFYPFNTLPSEVWSFFFKSGNHGVRIFFVISGFLITSMSLRRWKKLSDIDFKLFYRFRFARIFPPLILLIVVLSVLHIFSVNNYVISPQKASLQRSIIAAVTFHLNWLEGKVGYLPASWDVLWSLSVEEVFYLAFPIVSLFSKNKKVFYFSLILLIVIGPFYRVFTSSNEIWSTKAYFSCMDSIAIGCFASFWIQGREISKKSRSFISWVGLSLLIFILFFKRDSFFESIANAQLDETLLSIGVALILIGTVKAVCTGWTQKALAPIAWFGRISYEIYLTHVFVVFWGVDYFKTMKPNEETPLLVLVLVLIGSGLIGYVVEKFYSEPMNRYFRKDSN